MPVEAAPERAPIDPERGLDAAAVEERVRLGLSNDVPEVPSRTVGQILAGNILTRFNLLMCSLLAVVLACRAWKDALFGGVIVSNALVGIVQELRAKRTLDRLALLSAPHALVIRDGEEVEVAVSEIVLDDIVVLRPGRQVVADATVVATDDLEVDESLLTGESDPMAKQAGDGLLSGSFVVAGSGRAQVARVGADAYAARLAEEARRFTLSRSELRESVDRIITWVTWALIPTAIVLLWSALREGHRSVRDSIVTTTGAVVAMVPEGLILLTTVAFAVGVVRLARRRTLVQELPAIEILARVDVVCLDKTGTITSGDMVVADVLEIAEDGASPESPLEALAAIAWSDPNPNATQLALRARFDTSPEGWDLEEAVPFSSARKWSATQFAGHGSWVIGAPEMVLGDAPGRVSEVVEEQAEQGRRILALARSSSPLTGEELPPGLLPIALVLIEDEVRPDAPETLRYFAEEGVTLKVISGDSPVTVAAVAERAGLGRVPKVDARGLPEEIDDLAEVVESTTVFGRVSPHQKRAMVGALQARGHTVAMTGDGVNDVLALKDADVGIAMASGADATRAVAQLVLLDSNFSGLPQVVAEGRRVINNLQRVASLFLTKTTYAVVIAIVVGLSGLPYPFLPRHLTLVGTLTIGVPAFFLALAPNEERLTGRFFQKVARVAVPSGVVAAVATLGAYLWARGRPELAPEQAQTTAALVLTGVGMLVLVRTSRPFVLWKGFLIGTMGLLVVLAIVTEPGRRYFELELPTATGIWVVLGLVAASAAVLALVELAIAESIRRS